MSKEQSVRRGNTSGLIGLWNQRSNDDDLEKEEGAAGGNVLKIREDAARRISVRTPAPPVTKGFLGDGLNSPGKFRKTSEIVRPTFETSESNFVARNGTSV